MLFYFIAQAAERIYKFFDLAQVHGKNSYHSLQRSNSEVQAKHHCHISLYFEYVQHAIQGVISDPKLADLPYPGADSIESNTS